MGERFGYSLVAKMMKILILDVYPSRPYRLSKDTCGEYGTSNNFGDGFVARTLRWLMLKSVDWPPMSCMYVAGALRGKGHDVSYSRYYQKGSGFDLVLMTSAIISHETEIETICKIRGDGIRVGVMGAFATNMAEPYIKAGAFVVGGEPERYFMAEPIDNEKLAKLSGLVATDVAVDIDELPLPAWDLVLSETRPTFKLLGDDAVLPIYATKGCPYSCFEYCTYPLQQGRKVRLRDPGKVVAEMAYWQDSAGISSFIFRDPVFSINREHTVKLCDAIKKSGRLFRFVIETHLKNIDRELAMLLVEAGMDMVKVGVESVNKDNLRGANRFTLSETEEGERIRELQSLGLKTTCMFILGFPGDTEEDCLATIEYAKRLNPTFAQFSLFTPYPGTPVFDSFKGRILADRYENFDQYQLVFKHDRIARERARSLLSLAYSRYYFRPRWLWSFLRARFFSRKKS